MMLLPLVLLTVVASLITGVFGSFGSSISNIANGGHYIEDNKTVNDYCSSQYAKEFDDAVEYEDNILIIFLVDEDHEKYYTKVFVGYNVDDRIDSMFGGRYTEYGRQLTKNIGDNYEHSLSRNLSATVRGMSDEINNLNLDSSFIDDMGSPGEYLSHVTNNSSLDISDETINSALTKFTEETKIPIVIVIDDMDNVLDKSIRTSDIINVILALVIGGFAVYFIVRAFKKQRVVNNDDDKRNDGGEDDRDYFSNPR